MKFYWECRGNSGTCQRRHNSLEDAEACCEQNDKLVEREIRTMRDYGKRREYADKHTRRPVKLQDYSA